MTLSKKNQKKKNVKIRNRIDIDNYIAFLTKTTLQAIDVVFLRLLKSILKDIENMYIRHQDDKDDLVTWTEFNKYNRMNKMLKRIEQMSTKEIKEVAKTIKESQENVYIEEHNASIFVHEKELQKEIDFDVPSPKEIEKAIEQPLDKINVDKSLEKHKNDFKDKIRVIITQGIMNGDGYIKVAKEIEKELQTTQVKAERIARTEMHRAQSQAKLDSAMQLKNNGLEPKKKWHATLDNRTRHTHRHLDGVVKEVDEPFESSGCSGQAPGLFIGVSSAKENINCRCSMLIFLDENDLPTERRARGDDGKTYTVGDMTYREWEKYKRKRK
ncbi:TPA: phage head morphogenesis protein [Staphylococcus aureus]|nr:phage head morphogenesis protein [Staphylococcus aureus]HDH4173473.1 phage head morphogenesis protein [Staphylococcus aureus]HDH4460693.1 phage head morphogenesis protein [Staphylococcus aureus]